MTHYFSRFSMKHFSFQRLFKILYISTFIFSQLHAQQDPLPSWNNGIAKRSIISFVETVTKPTSPDFVTVDERIATFDNDGTLWCEQPMPVQAYFAFDRVKALAPQHPEWKTQEPFASILKGDYATALSGGDHAILELILATHTGMTSTEFEHTVKEWISTAKHPKTGKLYTDMVYQPMLEVLTYLRANGFKTYIVSGGGIEFMRPWAQKVYSIVPEQVIGSSVKTKFEMREGKPVLTRLPELNFNDDKSNKPVAIYQHIGRRPIAAFGNSRGDKEMLEYTQDSKGAHFELLVLHDDESREFAYGPARGLPNIKLGAFTQELDTQAKNNNWTVVSMKDDWKSIFPTQKPEITAIDILLEPDATMLKYASANNAQLLKVDPKGFALDATHSPHITMLQCFVRTADLENVYTAIQGVLEKTDVKTIQLNAYKYYYISTGKSGLAGIVAKPTPQLLALQSNIIAAAQSYMLKTAPITAFTAGHDNPEIDKQLIEYVSTFVQKGAGNNFNPHVTTGVAPRTYLDKMVAEPFNSFTFSPVGVAVYQLGPFGTAAKKLKGWDLR